MTPEEIKQLIQSTLEASLPAVIKGAFSQFEGHFADQLKPISDRLSQFEVATEAPATPETTEATDPLSKRLAKLEGELKASQDREQQRLAEAQDLHFQNTLGKSLAGKGNVLHQEVVSELLANRLKSGAIQKDGEWYTKDGAKLSEAVDSFFSTDAGLHFLPSNHQNGTGTPATRQPQGNQPANAKDASLDDMLGNISW